MKFKNCVLKVLHIFLLLTSTYILIMHFTVFKNILFYISWCGPVRKVHICTLTYVYCISLWLLTQLYQCILVLNSFLHLCREQALKVLSALGLNVSEQTAELVQRHMPLATQQVTLALAMAPQLLVEWLACHALRLYITQSAWDAAAILQQHIDLLPHSPGTLWVIYGFLWRKKVSNEM